MLIEKIATGGQLKASFLLRVLQHGQMDLFELGLASLLQIDVAGFLRLFYHGGPRPVALACRASGIDQCVFPTVYALSRKHRHFPCALQAPERAEVEAVFQSYSRREALAWFQASRSV